VQAAPPKVLHLNPHAARAAFPQPEPARRQPAHIYQVNIG